MYLLLDGNKITDISPLVGFRIVVLSLQKNNISDISPFSKLRNPVVVTLGDNPLSSESLLKLADIKKKVKVPEIFLEVKEFDGPEDLLR